MRESPRRLITLFLLPLVCALTAFVSGCATSSPDPVFEAYDPGVWAAPGAETAAEPAVEPAPVTAPPTVSAATDPVDLSGVLEVGDAVVVTLSGISSENILPHEERIKDDGTISLYLLGPVKAAGLTAGELQRNLQTSYERYYKNPVVTVNTAQRFYYVGGAVRAPGAKPYLGKTTVTKAIQAAGDLTDFGRKQNIQVIRTDGTTLKVNYRKATRDPSLDPPIYPGDKIHVPRRSI